MSLNRTSIDKSELKEKEEELLKSNMGRLKHQFLAMQHILEKRPITSATVLDLMTQSLRMRELLSSILKTLSIPKLGEVYGFIAKECHLQPLKLPLADIKTWRKIFQVNSEKLGENLAEVKHEEAQIKILSVHKGIFDFDLRVFLKNATNEEALLAINRIPLSNADYSDKRVCEQRKKAIHLKTDHSAAEVAELKKINRKLNKYAEKQAVYASYVDVISPEYTEAAHVHWYVQAQCDPNNQLAPFNLEIFELINRLEKIKPFIGHTAIGATVAPLSNEQRAINQLKALDLSLDPVKQMTNVQEIIKRNHLTEKMDKAGFIFTDITTVFKRRTLATKAKQLDEAILKKIKGPWTTTENKRHYLDELEKQIKLLNNDPERNDILKALAIYLKENNKNHLLAINTNSITYFFGKTYQPNSNSILKAISLLEHAAAPTESKRSSLRKP